MNPMIEIAIGSAMLSGVAAYVMWVLIRGANLRHDLLKIKLHAIRDAKQNKCLNDPSVQQGLELIDNLCESANQLNFVTFFAYLVSDEEQESKPREEFPTSDPNRTVALRLYSSIVNRAMIVVFYESLTGVVVFLAMRLLSTSLMKKVVEKTKRQLEMVWFHPPNHFKPHLG